MEATEYLDVPLEIKAVGEAGSFEGYASVFGNLDRGGDIVEAGAFAKSIKALGRDPLPMLWFHDPMEPIGVFTSIEEDSKGLKVEGRLEVPDDPVAVRMYAHLKSGAVRGLSIGYRISGAKGATMDANGTRRLKELELAEASLLTSGYAMNPKARVTAVKSFESVNSVRDFEQFLRDVGLPRDAAKAVCARGAAGLDLRDADDEAVAIVEALKAATARLRAT